MVFFVPMRFMQLPIPGRRRLISAEWHGSIAVAFSIGSKAYIGTGQDDSSYYKDFWEYDPATDTWTQKADFGGDRRDAPLLVFPSEARAM